MAKEEELSEQQKKRKAQVQFEAQFYTEEDWDAIRAKLEANAELTKDVLGKDLPEQDFAKRMVDMVNQRKKHFAEERAKAKRNKTHDQSQLRDLHSNYLKNSRKLGSFLSLKKEKLKRYGEELQTKTLKKQKIDDKDVLAIGEKVAEVKEEELVKRTGKRKKQKARKGISIDKNAWNGYLRKRQKTKPKRQNRTRNGKDCERQSQIEAEKSIKSKSQQKSQLVKVKVNPSQPRDQKSKI
ncbi:hypothetical protein Tco_1516644 [Tanacetum coccineum]